MAVRLTEKLPDHVVEILKGTLERLAIEYGDSWDRYTSRYLVEGSSNWTEKQKWKHVHCDIALYEAIEGLLEEHNNL